MGDKVALDVGDAVGVGMGDGVALDVGDAVGVGMGDSVALDVGDAVWLGMGDNVALGVSGGTMAVVVNGIVGLLSVTLLPIAGPGMHEHNRTSAEGIEIGTNKYLTR